MRQFILAGVLFLATFAAAAQNANAIKVIYPQGTPSRTAKDGLAPVGDEGFAILAQEDAEVSLKLWLKQDGKVKVVVKDRNDRLVCSRQYTKRGENRIFFPVESGGEYRVRIYDPGQTGLAVSVRGDVAGNEYDSE